MENSFKELNSLLLRWFKSANTGFISSVKNITHLFSKIFYIEIANKIGIDLDYNSAISENLLNDYGIRKENIPYYGSDKKISGNSITDYFPITNQREFREGNASEFFQKLLDILFMQVCKKLRISPKSDIRRELNVKVAKTYELKMFIEFITDLIAKKGDIKSNSNELLTLEGGLAGKFYDFLQYNLRIYMLNVRKMYRTTVPKNQRGAFFTPAWITDYIDHKVMQYWNEESDQTNKPPTIVDISCGLGSFLESFINPEFHEQYSDVFGNYNINEFGNFVYGYDKSEYLVDILRLNNAALNVLNLPHIQVANLIAIDSLFTPSRKKFDILVGNPPWGGIIDKKQAKKVPDLKKFADRQYDTFSLFTARNFLTLKPNGLMYLILPETILLNPNYITLRKYLIQQSTILEIIHLGEGIFPGVKMPSIMICLRKRKSDNDHDIRATILSDKGLKKDLKSGKINFDDLIKHHNDYEGIKIYSRKQSGFAENSNYELDIFTTDEERKLLKSVEEIETYKLKNLVDNSRGVEIGKQGKIIQCYHCKVWLSPPQWSIETHTGNQYSTCKVCNKKILRSKIKQRETIIIEAPAKTDAQLDRIFKDINYNKIFLGLNVNKFYANGFSIIKLGFRGVKYKDSNIYSKDKIILRKTSDNLAATIDYDGNYTIQVVYQFSVNESYEDIPYLLEYILGVITSPFIEFYYSRKHQYGNRKSFPHHIQSNVLNLPIPKFDYMDDSDPRYLSYLRIVYLTMMSMFARNIQHNEYVSKKLITRITNFRESYPHEFHQLDLENVTYSIFSCNLDDMIKNPRIIRNFDSIGEVLEKEINENVRKLFEIKEDE